LITTQSLCGGSFIPTAIFRLKRGQGLLAKDGDDIALSLKNAVEKDFLAKTPRAQYPVGQWL
jgi:hypothetical protein